MGVLGFTLFPGIKCSATPNIYTTFFYSVVANLHTKHDENMTLLRLMWQWK